MNQPATPENSCQELMLRLREGSHGAAAGVYERMQPRLMGLIRQQLANSPILAGIEAEDVLHSVLVTFYNRMQDGRLRPSGFPQWDNVWHLLAQIARRRVTRRRRKLLAKRRRDAPPHVPLATDDGSPLDVPDDGLKPEELLECGELLELLLARLDEPCRETLMLSLAGYSKADIAVKMGVSLRTVSRWMEKAQSDLEALIEEDSSDDEKEEI